MRKVLFSLLVITGLGFVANNAKAQTSALKIGVFDIDNFVQRTPDYKTVIQPKLESFQRDSLGPAKDNLDSVFNDKQNTYKADSLAKKSKATLDYDRQQLQELYYKEVNWQQIQQNETQRKFYEVAKPTYDKVIAAYKKAVADNKISLVLNPQAVSDVPDPKSIVNLFDVVATQMGIKLSNGQEEGQQQAAPPAGK